MNSFIPGESTRLPNEMSIDRSAAEWEHPTANAKFRLAAGTGKRRSLPKRRLDTAACDRSCPADQGVRNQDSTRRPPRRSQPPRLPRSLLYLCTCWRRLRFIPGVPLDWTLTPQPCTPSPNLHTEATVWVSMLVCMLSCTSASAYSNAGSFSADQINLAPQEILCHRLWVLISGLFQHCPSSEL